MKTYIALDGLRWSRDSGSANCDMPRSAVFGRSGGSTYPYPYTTDVTMEDFGDTSTHDGPIGSGLLIMVAAGAGYFLLKKKEEK